MKNLLVLLVLFFAVSTSAFCAELKMMVLSDTHISTDEDKNNRNSVLLTKSIRSLQEAIKQVNESDVDIVVFAGDNTNDPHKALTVVFAKIISKLNKPVYVVPGNHYLLRMQGVDKKEYYRLVNKFSGNKVKTVPSAKKMKGGLVLIFMNGINQYMPSKTGYFREKELLWLDEQLKKHKNSKVVIVQHFPLVARDTRKTYKPYNAEEYLNLLKKHDNIIAVVSGHTHTEDEFQQDGIMHIGVPSLFENQQYKEIDIEYGHKKTDYLIKTKVYSIGQE